MHTLNQRVFPVKVTEEGQILTLQLSNWDISFLLKILLLPASLHVIKLCSLIRRCIISSYHLLDGALTSCVRRDRTIPQDNYCLVQIKQNRIK